MLGFPGNINLPIRPEMSPADPTLPVCLSEGKAMKRERDGEKKMTPVEGEREGAEQDVAF